MKGRTFNELAALKGRDQAFDFFKDGDGYFRFRQSLLRDTAYEGLPFKLRRRLHATVAARVTGETDVTPTKALGPVTQLIYGVITPGNLSGNIMSANVTGGGTSGRFEKQGGGGLLLTGNNVQSHVYIVHTGYPGGCGMPA